MELVKNKWFYLVVGGVLMITISALLFGGFIHGLVQASGWGYLTFLAFTGSSSMITGILMMFDALNQKVRHEVEETIKRQEGEYDEEAEKQLAEEEKEHINFLVKRSESLKPERLKRNGNTS